MTDIPNFFDKESEFDAVGMRHTNSLSPMLRFLRRTLGRVFRQRFALKRIQSDMQLCVVVLLDFCDSVTASQVQTVDGRVESGAASNKEPLLSAEVLSGYVIGTSYLFCCWCGERDINNTEIPSCCSRGWRSGGKHVFLGQWMVKDGKGGGAKEREVLRVL